MTSFPTLSRSNGQPRVRISPEDFSEGDREHFLQSAILWEHDHAEEKLLVEDRAGVSLHTPCCDDSQRNETKLGKSNSTLISGISG